MQRVFVHTQNTNEATSDRNFLIPTYPSLPDPAAAEPQVIPALSLFNSCWIVLHLHGLRSARVAVTVQARGKQCIKGMASAITWT